MIQKAPKKESPKRAAKKPTVDELLAVIAKYEAKFEEIDSFLRFVGIERDELRVKSRQLADAKEAYESAKAEVNALRDSIAGAKDSLFQLLEPGVMEFMPLFDKMEPADPEKHGESADQWRRDPISALRLSAHAAGLLIDADVIVIGQLQDRVLDKPQDWWESIDGLTASVAAAIADKLNDFIYDDGGRK